MSSENGTIVLDARSKEKYDLLHIKEAINLSFPDIDVESLKKTLPDKYGPHPDLLQQQLPNAEEAFPSKLPRASLNLSTYIALYSYGYRNIYELGPQIDRLEAAVGVQEVIEHVGARSEARENLPSLRFGLRPYAIRHLMRV